MKPSRGTDKLWLIRNAREARRLTTRDMAKKLCLTNTTIAEYERGTFAPSPDTWEKMKVILDLEGEISDYWGAPRLAGRPRETPKDAVCRIEGCGKKIAARGLCWHHYFKDRNGTLDET